MRESNRNTPSPRRVVRSSVSPMKRITLASFFLVIASVMAAAQTQTQSQYPSPNPDTRPRIISPMPAQPRPSPPQPQPGPPASQRLGQIPTPDVLPGNKPEPRPPVAGPAATAGRSEQPAGIVYLMSPPLLHARISEAERLLKSRPLQTAMSTQSIDLVTLAALDRNTSRIHLVTLYKDTFLTKGAELTMTSSLGTPLSVRVLRANGVNTAVAIFDAQGRSLVPLVVEFPIERRGVFREMAYYTSAHPALLSPDLSRSGRAYVHRMIDLAVRRLREKGTFV